MTEANLSLTYEFGRDDDFGWLAATVDTDFVRATGGYWVQWQDVAEWAAALAQYPAKSDAPFDADWGYSEDGTHLPVVAISIASTDRTGPLEVSVALTDHVARRHAARSVLRVAPVALVRFAEDVAAMMRRERADAILTGRNV